MHSIDGFYDLPWIILVSYFALPKSRIMLMSKQCYLGKVPKQKTNKFEIIFWVTSTPMIL